ncbi:MAG: zinc-binding domain-containing protein [Benniella sp.]|nr:MAG: zinc-binding domain-containing protein [Benniella sp.]
MSDHGLPEQPSRDDVRNFYDSLVGMGAGDLNMLLIGAYPKWARKVLNEERCRRKNQGGTDTAPSSQERKRIIALGTPKSQGQSNKKGKKKKAAQDELDGEYLHSAVSAEASFNLVYNANLQRGEEQRATLPMVGTFACTHCSSKGWHSGNVATQVWFEKSTDRYRTLINCQKCKKCNQYAEPVMDVHIYVERLLSKFYLWKGLRDPIIPPDDDKSTGPHDSERCRGCEKGVCRFSERRTRQRERRL